MRSSSPIDHDRTTTSDPRSNNAMKALLATTTALGIGLLALAGATAAPINGAAIGQAAGTDQLMQQAHVVIARHRHYRHYRHRHCRWYHHRLICWRR
jgi:hypothetical protein